MNLFPQNMGYLGGGGGENAPHENKRHDWYQCGALHSGTVPHLF